MQRLGAALACTLAVGLPLVLAGCDEDGPTAPTPPPAQPPPSAPPIEWTIESGGNGHHYQLSLTLGNEADHFLSWTQARARAESLSFQGVSGHLVTITSQAENSFLVDRLVPVQRTPAPLIGGFQPPGSQEPAGGWQWVTGEPLNSTYTNWAPLEPNEGVPGADFLVFTADPEPTIGTWNDVADLVSIYIIEYDTTGPAVIASVSQRNAFSGDVLGTVDVSPFDPALGTLESVDVAITGTLTIEGTAFPNPIGPFGAPTPYTYRIIVTQDFSPGFAGKYFDFSAPAEFRFEGLPTTGVGDAIQIAAGFAYDFSFTEITDRVGFASLTTTSTAGSLIPPAMGALGTRADFLLEPPPLDLILLAQTWQAISFGGPNPVIVSVTAAGTLAITYHYTFVP